MRNVLVFQHEFREHPSRINQYALERNLELDVVRLWEPYEMPDPKKYAALIILGGSMGVYDSFASKEDELKVIRENVGKVPILGICLGSQLLAHALGAEVAPMAEKGGPKFELGFQDITLTEEGIRSPFFKGFPKTFSVAQIHGDTFDLPEGAARLAEESTCRNQAFSYGNNAFGTQFHLEYTPYAFAHIVEKHKDKAQGNPEEAEKRLMDQAFKNEAVLKKQFDLMMDNFFSIAV